MCRVVGFLTLSTIACSSQEPIEPGFEVAIVTPEDGTTNIVADQVVTTLAMPRRFGHRVGYTDIEKAFSLIDQSGIRVLGTFSYSREGDAGQYMAIRFRPTNNLKMDTDHQARIVAAGDVIPANAEYDRTRFRVGSMPRVRKLRFAPKGAGNIVYSEIVFSETVANPTVSNAISFVDSSGSPISSTSEAMSLDNLKTVITFAAPFQPNTTVTVRIASSVAATSGVRLDGTGKSQPGTEFKVSIAPSSLPMSNGAYELRPWVTP